MYVKPASNKIFCDANQYQQSSPTIYAPSIPVMVFVQNSVSYAINYVMHDKTCTSLFKYLQLLGTKAIFISH